MVSAGLLKLDTQGHGGLNVTSKGEAISEGSARFEYRLKNTKTSAPSRQPAPVTANLDDVESELFFILKELRLRIAQDNKVPPYVIFPDKTLADMARRQPHPR